VKEAVSREKGGERLQYYKWQPVVRQYACFRTNHFKIWA